MLALLLLGAGSTIIGRCDAKLPAHRNALSTAAVTATAVGVERGNTFEGYGSANWSWGRYKGYKFAISFKPAMSKTLDSIWIVWKSASGYGGGNLGTWTFELHADNAANHTPAPAVLQTTKRKAVKVTGLRKPPDGYLKVNLPNVAVTAGKIYHLVIYNTDKNPQKNWSSPNTIMSRPDIPWQGEGCMSYDGKKWSPWGSLSNPVAPGQGGRAAYALVYTDNTAEGLPYYSATMRFIFQATYEGEVFPWNSPTVSVTGLGTSVFSAGTPAGPLRIVLEEVDGIILTDQILVNPAQVSAVPTWFTVTLPTPITLEQGKNYRLSLRADTCTDTNNCYVITMPYSSQQVPGWMAATWGGSGSYGIFFNGSTWQKETVPEPDLSFSLIVQ